MGKYVDIDAVIAELKRRQKKNVLNEGAFEEDIDIIHYLESLKTKEVNVELDELLSDLDKEIKDFITTDEFDRESAIGGHYWAIAKHAFLLGIRHGNKSFNSK